MKKTGSVVGDVAEKPHQIWVHDNDLIAVAEHSAQRIMTATGIPIVINAPGTITSSIPMFWTDQLCAENYGGFFVESSCGGFLMVSKDCHPELMDTVVTHEMIHSLGVLSHLPEGQEGLMLHNGGKGRITENDLNLICSIKNCSAYIPEAGSSPQ